MLWIRTEVLAQELLNKQCQSIQGQIQDIHDVPDWQMHQTDVAVVEQSQHRLMQEAQVMCY
jgi:hypothetical protein